MQFKINFTNDISMIYDLVDEEIAQQWAILIARRNTTELCKINHLTGYGSEQLINERIHRLHELADEINTYDVNRVIKQEINKDTWKVALHIMHVHFPDMKNDPKYQKAWPLLTEYNDILHWLESVLLYVWDKDTGSSLFRVALDFNKTVFEFYDIPESAYKLFTPFTKFGDLSLHYTHVGKHALELFTVNDFECPPEQFVPQRKFNASCRLSLRDNVFESIDSISEYNDKWNKFYKDRGGIDFWKLDITDPKLAFGYCRIGSMSSLIVNGIETKIPQTQIEINSFREKIVNSKVIDWEIK
jgi:hypothetical protein